MRTLPVVHTLGGCGGTLLAKLLGCLDGVVLLSECNPSSANLFEQSLNPFVQLRDWYPDLFPAVAGGFKAQDMTCDDGFRDFMRAAFDAAEANGSRLVLRDYNYIDFFGVPFIETPSQRSSLRRGLGDAFDLRAAVLVRYPLDQYGSLRSHAILKDVLSPDIFLSGYGAFLDEVGTSELLHYERLVESPAATLQDLCARFGLRYHEDVLTGFQGHQRVTGNRSRDAETTISPSSRPLMTDTWTLELQEQPAYCTLLARLGYPLRRNAASPLSSSASS